MFKRILVPLDGSDSAEQAIPLAARIARASGGTVILVQVVPIHIDFRAEAKQPAEIYPENIIEEGKSLAFNYLDNVSRIAELVGVETETRVEHGNVAPSILAAVEPLEVDLIVMCSHGYSGFKRWALGSIAHKIIAHSPVPVLVLRDGGPTLTTKAVSALVALDGSPLAESVLDPVVQLATALAPSMHITLHLVRVIDLPATYSHSRFAANAFVDQLREDAKHEAQAYLAAVAQRLIDREDTLPDLIVTTSIAVNPDVAEALLQMTEQELHAGGRFDLVAMATHGRGGLQRWVMGSVTEHVLHHSKLPLLIVRPLKKQQGSKQEEQPVAVEEQSWVGLL
jgi:nucleotide-binding universal stress UspA family protein